MKIGTKIFLGIILSVSVVLMIVFANSMQVVPTVTKEFYFFLICYVVALITTLKLTKS